MNSAALRFIPKEDLEKEGYGEYSKLFSKKWKSLILRRSQGLIISAVPQRVWKPKTHNAEPWKCHSELVSESLRGKVVSAYHLLVWVGEIPDQVRDDNPFFFKMSVSRFSFRWDFQELTHQQICLRPFGKLHRQKIVDVQKRTKWQLVAPPFTGGGLYRPIRLYRRQ